MKTQTGGSRSRVKSGCRTCKVRKIKCDEGRPACNRCTSAGRVCEGYGIWGGGGVILTQHVQLGLSTGSTPCMLIPQPSISVPAASGTSEEHLVFEWFRNRAARKLQGSLVLNFWDTLLIQASLTEPAIYHAVLALSSVHKQNPTGVEICGTPEDAPDKHEQFTLRHYVKAIHHLQPHLASNDRPSLRIALIACVVFVGLDFLRGHFRAGQLHLLKGLKIMQDVGLVSNQGDGVICWRPCRQPTDDWIVEAFSRLQLQVELFDYSHAHPCLIILRAPEPEISETTAFRSFNEAWQLMTQLFNKIFYLADQARQGADSRSEFPPLLDQHQHVREQLSLWLEAYERSREALNQNGSPWYSGRIYPLLSAYQTMACIMADTALQPEDETVFDKHTSSFIMLIIQLAGLWSTTITSSNIQALPGNAVDMHRSILDAGWLPPLFFVATKCRVHRIRLQAVKLLEAASHREGIWDATATARVARKIMELEEGDFYVDVENIDDFSLTRSPAPQELLLPVLPVERRIQEAEVILSGAPMDQIFLYCKQKQGGVYDRVLLSEYDVGSQRWTDR
ncbi:hypothetical protein QBC34DRAFT_353613 [Podospora aff. communis PSN243]|uniref:Zn(2)-C6 fungal-type domain-containing protein n=1 Tax=Podospora aff. communis PSN243 TaxID=3040156 RepID=A0AAV9GK52_9PEZI|nr:hypothetical protein QBC34DRAFT_353613 [Podospora aff. communis PSN243]